MPVDLLAEQSEIQQPKDLLADDTSLHQKMPYGVQLPAYAPKPVQRIAASTASALSNIGHGLYNFPGQLAKEVGSPLAENLPHSDPASLTTWRQRFGIEPSQPATLGDRLLQNMVEYTPYALGGEAAVGFKSLGIAPRLAQQGIVGGLYGLTQSEKPLVGAAEGAGTNMALTGLGAGLGAAPSLPKKLFSKFAAEGLSKSVGDILNDAKNIRNSDVFETAKNNLETKEAEEKAAWNKAKQGAQQLDNSGIPFDDTQHVNRLNSEAEKLRGQSEKQSGFARKNADSINYLDKYIQDEHGTFQDALEHNQAINADYGVEMTPGKSPPFDTLKFAHSSIKNAIDENIEKNGLQDTFGKDWKEANALTAEKNDTFHKIVSAKGAEQQSSFSKLIQGKAAAGTDPTTFIGDYIPKGRGEGIEKMQQFTKMIGDPEKAKSALKANYFDDAYKTDRIDANKFLNKYDNLSKEQIDYLFKPQEQQMIRALSKIRANHPEMLSSSKREGFTRHSISGALGMVIGHLVGLPYMEGALGGLVASKGISGMLTSLAGKPSMQKSITNYLLSPKKSPGLLEQFGRGIVRTTARPTLQSLFMGDQQNGS